MNGRCTNVYVRSICPVCGESEFPNEQAACARAKAWAEAQVEADNAIYADEAPSAHERFVALFDSYDDYEWDG